MAMINKDEPAVEESAVRNQEVDSNVRHRVFLARLRHELRTPLNAIIGYSEMLIEDFDEEEYADISVTLNSIRAAGMDLLTAINDLLSKERIAAGELDVELEILGAKLHQGLDESIALVVESSRECLDQAGHNSIDEIIPDLEKIASAGERLSSMLDDLSEQDGAGRSSDWDEREMVAALAKDAVATLLSLDERGAEKSGSHGSILVVDDNEMNRDVLSRHLARQGHSLAQAENGRQALAMMDSQDFDLILLDVMMPEPDGYQVLQRLKSNKTWRDVPVIMISALDELQSIVRCIELGAEDYLPKPFDPVLLRARIGASLEKKRLRDQEVEYLRNVALVTAAAAVVESETATPEELGLETVAERPDALGQLARVFQGMAREVYAREQRLKQQVHELTIELDDAKQAQQVEEILESDYFQELEASADELRNIMDGL